MKHRLHLQIALVGGQPTPVYQGIVHMQPDQILLVCSKETKGIARNIRAQLPSYAEKDVMIYQISDTDIQQMYKTAEMIEQSLIKGITISLNISSGMKLWSIIFNNVFRRKRRSCRTFCIGQDGMLFDLKEKVTKAQVAFDMDTQFKILGHTLKEFSPLSEYTTEDFDVFSHVKDLGFNGKTHQNFHNLTSQFYDSYKRLYGNTLLQKSYQTTYLHHKLVWDAEFQQFQCTINGKEQVFKSPHAPNIVLNTGWFELYVAQFISNKYPTNQIRLNCVFRNKKNTPKNEIDIIVNTGRKLIFVECKTQIFDTTDIDKFRSAVHNYGGLGSKALFVTNAPMKPEAEEKCRDHGISTFSFSRYHTGKEKADALATLLENLDNTWNYK